jgi:hypothetical protein
MMAKSLLIGLALLIYILPANFCQATIASSDLAGVWMGTVDLVDGNGKLQHIPIFISIDEDIITSSNTANATHFFGLIYLDGVKLPHPFDKLPPWFGIPFSGAVLNDDTIIMTADESLIRAKFRPLKGQIYPSPVIQGFMQLTDNFPVNTATGKIYVRKAHAF